MSSERCVCAREHVSARPSFLLARIQRVRGTDRHLSVWRGRSQQIWQTRPAMIQRHGGIMWACLRSEHISAVRWRVRGVGGGSIETSGATSGLLGTAALFTLHIKSVDNTNLSAFHGASVEISTMSNGPPRAETNHQRRIVFRPWLRLRTTGVVACGRCMSQLIDCETEVLRQINRPSAEVFIKCVSIVSQRSYASCSATVWRLS